MHPDTDDVGSKLRPDLVIVIPREFVLLLAFAGWVGMLGMAVIGAWLTRGF